jgi:hypothetical protein
MDQRWEMGDGDRRRRIEQRTMGAGAINGVTESVRVALAKISRVQFLQELYCRQMM